MHPSNNQSFAVASAVISAREPPSFTPARAPAAQPLAESPTRQIQSVPTTHPDGMGCGMGYEESERNDPHRSSSSSRIVGRSMQGCPDASAQRCMHEGRPPTCLGRCGVLQQLRIPSPTALQVQPADQTAAPPAHPRPVARIALSAFARP